MSPDVLLKRIKYEMTQIKNEYCVIDSVIVLGKPTLNEVEIRAVASSLHSIYNGIEKILMMSLKQMGISYDMDNSWHSNILKLSQSNHLISEQTENQLRRLMGFRHFFRHSYGFMLDDELMRPLYSSVGLLITNFRSEIMKNN